MMTHWWCWINDVFDHWLCYEYWRCFEVWQSNWPELVSVHNSIVAIFMDGSHQTTVNLLWWHHSFHGSYYSAVHTLGLWSSKFVALFPSPHSEPPWLRYRKLVLGHTTGSPRYLDMCGKLPGTFALLVLSPSGPQMIKPYLPSFQSLHLCTRFFLLLRLRERR